MTDMSRLPCDGKFSIPLRPSFLCRTRGGQSMEKQETIGQPRFNLPRRTPLPKLLIPTAFHSQFLSLLERVLGWRNMVTLRPVHRTNILNQRLLRNVSGTRFLTSSHTDPVPEPSSLHPSWLSDTKARIGKCIMFGMKPELVDEAGKILYEISRDWRELVAGSEGFLTSKDRTGLDRQEIVWGEQDSMGHVNNVMYVRFAESGRFN